MTPVCGGRGFITTELVFMDPVTTECEACGGKRYSDMALSYLSLGQSASTLSGGERQRLKLAKDLDKKGNTVIIIEHNLDVMKLADYIIDVGPDGGRFGGEIVFAGTPQEMVGHCNTITAKCLKNFLRS